MEILALFFFLILLMLLTVPIGVSVGIASILVVAFTGIIDLNFVVRSVVTAYDSFPILAIPLFLLAGEIMSKGGISERLFNVAALVVGRFTGGIPMAVVAACLMFGALSGSAAADTAAIGSIMIPAMIRMGYNAVFATTLVAASGSLGVIMPPSLLMIMYGVSSNTSIGKLFIAGVLPAFIVTICLMFYCYWYCRTKGYTNDKMNFQFQLDNKWKVIKSALPSLLAPVIILGGIYGGIFTPTEAGGIAVLYSLLLSILVYKTIKVNKLFDVFSQATRLVGPIMITMGAATIFSRVLTIERVPNMIADAIVKVSDNPIVFLLLVNILLLFVGMLMETLSSIVILTPIFFPIAIQLGIDPVHFGLIMVVNLAIGFITPPLAGNLFIVSSIAGLPVERVAKGILGPLAVLLFVLLLITYVPAITLYLPGLMK